MAVRFDLGDDDNPLHEGETRSYTFTVYDKNGPAGGTLAGDVSTWEFSWRLGDDIEIADADFDKSSAASSIVVATILPAHTSALAGRGGKKHALRRVDAGNEAVLAKGEIKVERCP